MATTTLSRRSPAISPALLAWLAFIGLAGLIGLVSVYEVLSKGLEVTNLTDSVPWGLWITIDLSSIALGAGAFTLSAVVYLFGLKRFQPIVRLAVFVGFIGYSGALLAARVGVRRSAHQVHRAAPVLAVAGLLISLLHQSSLGATYGILRSRPIWFKPSMPIMFVISAIAVGPAVAMAAAHMIEWVTGRKTVPHDILRTIARFSGLGLLLYAYIKLWDLAAVSYYGRTPASDSALFLLRAETPYNFGFWVGEMFLGILVPVVFFLMSRFNRRPFYLVMGALAATAGILFNRWNVTVSGLVVPVTYSPRVLNQLP